VSDAALEPGFAAVLDPRAQMKGGEREQRTDDAAGTCGDGFCDVDLVHGWGKEAKPSA
jgi:hypothetical protein